MNSEICLGEAGSNIIDFATDAVQVQAPRTVAVNTAYNIPVIKKPRYIFGIIKSTTESYIYQFVQDVYNNKQLIINVIAAGSSSNAFVLRDGVYDTLQEISNDKIVFKSTVGLKTGLLEMWVIY